MFARLTLASALSLSMLSGCVADVTDNGDIAFETESPDLGKADHLGIELETLQTFVGDKRFGGGLTILTSAARYEDYFGQDAPAEVDFDNEWLVFFGIGSRSTGGYGAAITGIDFYPSWGGFVVNTVESSPGLDCMVTRAFTAPYTLAKFDIPNPVPHWYANAHESVTNDCFPDKDELFAQLEESLQVWDDLVDANGEDYTYTREFLSWTGFGGRTTLVVHDGVVTERHYKAQHINGGDATIWSEVGEELGSHLEGAAVLVIDDLYGICKNDVLTKDQTENFINLFVHDTGILGNCDWAPRLCLDDCSRGVDIQTVEFDN